MTWNPRWGSAISPLAFSRRSAASVAGSELLELEEVVGWRAPTPRALTCASSALEIAARP
jgi:hypothetical protein